MLRKFISVLLIVSLLVLIGCSTHHHTIGAGAKGGDSVSKKQWYILFGLVPLNNVDTKVMAAGASDYDIKTESNFVDVVIGLFTGILTIPAPRTVTVTK